MGFNYGLEKKNFDRQWAIMRKQYEDAGMSIEVIQAMYEYDWSFSMPHVLTRTTHRKSLPRPLSRAKNPTRPL